MIMAHGEMNIKIIKMLFTTLEFADVVEEMPLS
jgi:hypothetical protein